MKVSYFMIKNDFIIKQCTIKIFGKDLLKHYFYTYVNCKFLYSFIFTLFILSYKVSIF